MSKVFQSNYASAFSSTNIQKLNNTMGITIGQAVSHRDRISQGLVRVALASSHHHS